MSNVLPLVRQLQADSVNPDVPVAKLLRLAKVIATKLGQVDALQWINLELDGYMNRKFDEVPEYRMLNGLAKGYNPYRGWQPITFKDLEDEQVFSRVPLRQSIGSVEKDLTTGLGGDTITFPYPPEVKATLMNALSVRLDVALFLSKGQLWGVVEAVRNLVLDWSLELEKVGVLGQEMTFTEEEKKEAGAVTQQYIIQNVGVLGNVTDQGNVRNVQIAHSTLDRAAVASFAQQVMAALNQLPSKTRRNLEPILSEIYSENEKPKRDTTKLRELLASARTIAEGALGNLAASGIVQMIGRILGA